MDGYTSRKGTGHGKHKQNKKTTGGLKAQNGRYCYTLLEGAVSVPFEQPVSYGTNLTCSEIALARGATMRKTRNSRREGGMGMRRSDWGGGEKREKIFADMKKKSECMVVVVRGGFVGE